MNWTTSLACAASLFCASSFAASLTVEVHGLTSDKGDLVINVYTSKKTWMEDKQRDIFHQHIVTLKNEVTDGVITTNLDLPEGEYGLHIFQDWDQNKEMDANWLGIPREPVATSNNAKGSMGPPRYKDAKFTLTSDGATQVVNIVEI
ncbi:DUF2141 domain-containing protein [Thalassotalea maritima]|uniref:DUF2141 domain-containing protein n=1 Tax=Thalassotalea maritima TaxID=3242416 RepID=UPI00352815D8